MHEFQEIGRFVFKYYSIICFKIVRILYIVMIIFCFIASLGPGATIAVTLGIDFNDTTQSAGFNLW